MSTPSTSSGTFIDEAEAAEMTARYRSEYPGARKALFFGSEKIQDLLATGGIGIRIYYGISDTDQPELVLVGVDSNGNDDLDLILDRGVPCPDECGAGNSLNGI